MSFIDTKKHKIDRPLLLIIFGLLIYGLVIFLSASLSLFAKEGATFGSVAFNQIFFGIFLGCLFAFLISKIPYKFWGAYSMLFWILSIFLTLAVFIPGLGFSHGGATRWISIGALSFQPSEILKFAYIIVLATWFSKHKKEIQTFKFGFLPFISFSVISGFVLLLQPDTDSALIMIASGLILYFVAGAKIRYVALIFLAGLILGFILIMLRPYLLERITTFMNPNFDPQNSSFQIRQSLIAIGSGELFGRGFGQSLQKFSYLPEPIGDSIFAVLSEEFGFLGAFILIILFMILLWRGIYLSTKTIDSFGGLLMLGIVIMIVSQASINMASMLGLFPLSGLTLPFVSHGGTALFFTMCAVGILFNVSKYTK